MDKQAILRRLQKIFFGFDLDSIIDRDQFLEVDLDPAGSVTFSIPIIMEGSRDQRKQHRQVEITFYQRKGKLKHSIVSRETEKGWTSVWDTWGYDVG